MSYYVVEPASRAMSIAPPLAQLVMVAVAGIYVHAIAAVSLGSGPSTSASTLRRLARRCGLSAALLIMLHALPAVLELHDGLSLADATERATHLARGISEALNCGVFAVLGSALPVGAWLWLSGRARHME
jgi:hypothetical protein